MSSQPYERALGIYDVRIPEAVRMQRHGHDSALLCAVLSGSCVERVGAREVTFHPGVVRVSGPGVEHDLRVDPGTRFLLIEMPPDLWSDVGPTSPRRAPASVFSPSTEVFGLTTAFGVLAGSSSLADDLVVEDQLREIVARAMRAEGTPRFGPPPTWLRRVRERLRDEPAEATGLREIAEAEGVHPSHLARAFRSHYGETVGAFVRRHRLAVARTLLTGTGRTIAQIAAAAGFADQAHLTRECRRRWKTTPAALRRNSHSRPGRDRLTRSLQA